MYARTRSRLLFALGLPAAAALAASARAPREASAAASSVSGGDGASANAQRPTGGGCLQFVCIEQPARAPGPCAPAPYNRCPATLPPGVIDWAPAGLPFSRADTAAHREVLGRDHPRCCYEWRHPCGGGRPLHDALDRTVLAPAVTRGDWA